jgi:hypothetical protein
MPLQVIVLRHKTPTVTPISWTYLLYVIKLDFNSSQHLLTYYVT